MTKKAIGFCKSQPVLIAAFTAALITMFFVPPDSEYTSYCSRTVLIQLFCLMAAVAGLRSTGIFENITGLLLKRAGTVRKLGIILTSVCFFSSMLVTNDVALITFIPLTLLIYEYIPNEKSRIYTIVLETAAANLGSMATPFGNPQNLYIYDLYKMNPSDFFSTMLPWSVLSLVCLILLCILLPKDPCDAKPSDKTSVSKPLCSVYLLLFTLCLLTVFRVIPDIVCLAITAVIILIINKKILLKVDYSLLATFVCFFVFVGNFSRIESVRTFFSDILAGRELLVSAILSQGISNVPAAVMLSGFTENGKELLLGVNIGGLGTIIASLASLISFQFYRKSKNAVPGKFILIFSAVNYVIFLPLLLLALTATMKG